MKKVSLSGSILNASAEFQRERYHKFKKIQEERDEFDVTIQESKSLMEGDLTVLGNSYRGGMGSKKEMSPYVSVRTPNKTYQSEKFNYIPQPPSHKKPQTASSYAHSSGRKKQRTYSSQIKSASANLQERIWDHGSISSMNFFNSDSKNDNLNRTTAYSTFLPSSSCLSQINLSQKNKKNIRNILFWKKKKEKLRADASERHESKKHIDEAKIQQIREREKELIDKLEETQVKNKELLENLEKMKGVNKDLLVEIQEKKAPQVGKVHSFYQNVLLPDADKQIEALFYEIQEMKDQLKSSKSERTKLRKENKELKKIIERYRKIVGDFQAEQQIVGRKTPRVSSPDVRRAPSFSISSTPKSGEENYSFSRLVSAQIENKSAFNRCTSLRLPLKMTSNSSISLVGGESSTGGRRSHQDMILCFELLSSSLKKVNSVNTLKELITTIYREVPLFTNSQKIGVYILDQTLRKIFQNEEGNGQNILLEEEWIDLAIHESAYSSSAPQVQQAFNSKKHLKGGIKKNHLICLPVMGKEKFKGGEDNTDIYLAIQIQDKTRRAQRNTIQNVTYKLQDELALNGFCFHVSNTIEKLLSIYKLHQNYNFVENIQDLFSWICGERNHQVISNKLEEILPQILNFQKATVLFFDSNSNSLYTIQGAKGQDGEVFISSIIKYPSTVGLSGKAVKKKKIIMSNEGASDVRYNPEVDNISATKHIHNLLLCPLLGHKKELVGLLQLTNKNEGLISYKDLEKAQALMLPIAKSIDNADSINYAFNILVGLQKHCGNADKLVDLGNDTMRNEIQSGRLLNTQMGNINKLLGELVDSKKTQFFKQTSAYFSVFYK